MVGQRLPQSGSGNMKSKAKPTPFCDTMDRMFTLSNLHNVAVNQQPCNPKYFTGYISGKFTHVLIAKDDGIHIRFLPREQTQWLFDSYGS